MIDKEEARRQGIAIVDTDEQLASEKEALLERLQELLPGVVNSDRCVDVRALRDVVEINNTTSNDQGYELTFAGKGLARAQADDLTTDYELRTELEQSKNFDSTSNVVIRGDNLDVLKILYQNYYGKIKMIYIDPPYNTQSEGFIYKDNFRQSDAELTEQFGMSEETTDFLHNVYGTRSHSGWLAFMYPRLKLASQLIREDGVIFISIDDNEQANLKIICDEIFGAENFLYQLTVVNSLNGNDNRSGMMETHEFCLIYAKNINCFTIGVLNLTEDEMNLWQEDELGFWKEGGSLKATGVGARRSARPKLFFPIYIDEKNLTFSLVKNEIHTFEIYPITNEQEMRWYWNEEKFAKDKNEVIVKRVKDGYALYKKQRPSLGDLPSKRGKTTFYKPEYSTANGTSQIKRIFGDRVFDNPKPSQFIKDLIHLGMLEKDATVLDFFAGSGTTGDAVMQLNAEDGGSRKFILVQQDEEIDSKNNAEAYQFCTANGMKPVISSITIERLNRVGERIRGGGGVGSDVGYKVYSLALKPKLTDQGGDTMQFELHNMRPSALDTLTNMLCATCKQLDIQVDCIVEGKLYKADDELYVLDTIPPDTLEPYQGLKINLNGWANFSLTDFLNIGVHDEGKKDNLTVVY